MEQHGSRTLGPQLAALALLLLATAVLYASQVGLVTAAYFTGFGLGAFYGSILIRRVGHIRAFGGLLATVICAVLLLPLLESFWL